MLGLISLTSHSQTQTSVSSRTEVHLSRREIDKQGQLWFLSLSPFGLNLCLLPLVPNWLS
jgi:hypothetical protein